MYYIRFGEHTLKNTNIESLDRETKKGGSRCGGHYPPEWR